MPASSSTGDPDMDAVLAGTTQTAGPSSSIGDPDMDAVLNAQSSSAPLDLRTEPNLLKILGYGTEQLAGGMAHGIGTLVDMATGTGPGPGSHAERFQQAVTPFPVPTTVQDVEQQKKLEKVSTAYDRTFGTGPAAQTFKERIPQAAEAISMAVPMLRTAGNVTSSFKSGPTLSAQEVIDQTVANSPESMGAARAAPNVQQATPELQQAIVRAAQKTGGAVNPDALGRHLEANSLPVPMQLTEGQALQDPVALSREMNLRGTQPALAARFNEQNNQLVRNLQAIRDQVGPDVFSTNQVEHADTLIGAYKTKAAAADAVTNANYEALRKSAGGDFPVSAPQLLENTTRALHKELLFDNAPKSVMSTLGRLADSDNMTYENFESLRTNLARIMRSSTDGNERAAAGIIRNEMEKLPLQPGSASLKPLADTARASARTQFQALEADPAYKASVNDSVPAERFVQKFVIGGSRDDVATMRKNLAEDPVAVQTMGVATLDHLRRQAGIDEMGNGNFSQAGFNKHLQALNPKLNSLVEPETADTLEKLGNVARYTQFQPRGSFVNNSNTFVAAAAEHAKNLAEHGTNVAFGGIPVGTITRKIGSKLIEKRDINQALAPGAGLSRLSDMTKP